MAVVGGVSMPRKPKASAPKGPAWDPDIYDISTFVHGLNHLTATISVAPLVVGELACLARAVDAEAFHRGILFSVEAAHSDFPLLSASVYRGDLIDLIEEVETAACCLRDKLQAIKNPANRTSLWAGRAIRGELEREARETEDATHRLEPFNPCLRDLTALIEAAGKAKTSSIYVDFAREKGAPSGTGKSGMALTRFVAHLTFAALAAGGGWTLDKNDESGTLIDAFEKLRRYFLPMNFLPPADQHPYSTYQKILTDARFEWNLGHFPWEEVDRKK